MYKQFVKEWKYEFKYFYIIQMTMTCKVKYNRHLLNTLEDIINLLKTLLPNNILLVRKS